MRLEGKIALITGAGRGIGRALALDLAGEGCDVAVLARTGAQVAAVADAVRATGRRSLALAGDIADRQFLAQALAAIGAGLGPVDMLVHNAAVVEPLGRTAEVDPEQWEQALAINLTAAFRLARACLPPMIARGWGRIVSVSTGAAAGAGLQHANAYSASKAGLEMLTLNLAAELAGSGVTANVVRPGVVDTAMQTHIRSLPAERVGEQMIARFTGFFESGALLDPARPAHLITNLLASERNGELVDIYSPAGQELLG
jgi:NAD(P)-dependent dehydrogenase (short-subunit alcohol dehydrogenase family)